MTNPAPFSPLTVPGPDVVGRARPGRRGAAVGLRRFRLAQVRATSALMRRLTGVRTLAPLVARVRKWPVARQAIDWAAGYNRVFPDLSAAREVAQRYARHGHDSAENARGLRDDMATTRPSDYPVLFHLLGLPLDGLRVFDLGGTSGNLFYLYDRYLNFPASLRWTVHDLPGHAERGREFARQRGESRLHFTDDPNGASGSDVLLVSGSLHYFDFALADYVAGLGRRPRHVLVNRTPLVNAPTAATVQNSHHGVMVACRLLNRAELVAGMGGLGYELVDSWRAPEFSISLPYDPEYWVKEYSGAYFRAGDSCWRP
jgi:putative methyltransferase (TIGR04325 family)